VIKTLPENKIYCKINGIYFIALEFQGWENNLELETLIMYVIEICVTIVFKNVPFG